MVSLSLAVIFGVSVRYLREIVVVPEETGEPTPQTVHKHIQLDDMVVAADWRQMLNFI